MIKMFFDRGDLKINILSVLSLSWRETNAYAAGRPFDALSYRNRGNADFTYSDKTLHVQSGDVIFVPRDLDYHLAAQDEELTVVHFEIENAAEYDIDLITPIDSLYFKKSLILFMSYGLKNSSAMNTNVCPSCTEYSQSCTDKNAKPKLMSSVM